MSRIYDLYTLAMQGEASAAQLDELMRLLTHADHESDSLQLIREAISAGYAHGTSMATEKIVQIKQAIIHSDLVVSDEVTTNAGLKSAANNLSESPFVPPVRRVHFLRTVWFRYAAILLLIAGTATFLYRASQKPQKEIVKTPLTKEQDIRPGGNKAMLTLSDGSTIVIDSAANGVLAQQGNTRILKLNEDALIYNMDNPEGAELLYNTVTTPKGSQYQIVLPDGSKVWLNAASSIHFPTVFLNDRKVTVTGEAYFEIAHDKNKIFHVYANGTEVEVLGTSFNINTYLDEPFTKTTLLKGSVRVKNGNQSLVLQPGQQARISKVSGQSATLIGSPDIDQVIAWKNGFFNFNNASLQEVMRQLSRWYGIDIVYEKNIPDIVFGGEMGRSLALKDVLLALEKSKVHFRMEDAAKRLVVLP